jgi:hypothetical protein
MGSFPALAIARERQANLSIRRSSGELMIETENKILSDDLEVRAVFATALPFGEYVQSLRNHVAALRVTVWTRRRAPI